MTAMQQATAAGVAACSATWTASLAGTSPSAPAIGGQGRLRQQRRCPSGVRVDRPWLGDRNALVSLPGPTGTMTVVTDAAPYLPRRWCRPARSERHVLELSEPAQIRRSSALRRPAKASDIG